MGIARFLLGLSLGIILPLLVQLNDKRRLNREQLDRAWNYASWASALYAFGPLSMLGWGWVTRRTVFGLLLGAVATVTIFALIVAADALFAWLFGLRGPLE